MIWNKTIEGITKQFTVMMTDLDTIMENEAKNTNDLNDRIQGLEGDLNASLDNQKKALRIKNNIKGLLS